MVGVVETLGARLNAPAVAIGLRGEVRAEESVLALGLTVGMRPGAGAGAGAGRQLPSHHNEGKVCDRWKRKLGHCGG
jgi:hypothetical protein